MITVFHGLSFGKGRRPASDGLESLPVALGDDAGSLVELQATAKMASVEHPKIERRISDMRVVRFTSG